MELQDPLDATKKKKKKNVISVAYSRHRRYSSDVLMLSAAVFVVVVVITDVKFDGDTKLFVLKKKSSNKYVSIYMYVIV